MSAEKNSLIRFLVIYILSTLFLIGIGEYFYYKLAYKDIVQEQKVILKNQINEFINDNPFIMRKIRLGTFNIPKNMKVLIYFNNSLVYSNTKPLDIKETYTEIKRWGKIKIIATEKFNRKKLQKIIKELIVFNLFLLFFIILIAFFLGKLFLKPLKNQILMLEDFIRDATHEMNTPLSIILTNTELLDEKSKPVKRIKNAALRLHKIFEDLKYLQLNHKRQKIIEKINLKNFLKERLNLFESVIENKKLKIKTDLDEVILNIDKEDLIRIVDNLLSNAFKYSPENSEIIIKVKQDKFCIENVGHIKNIQKITKKFYRENKNEGGFGLGLYIVSKIAEEYNFTFVIENKKEKVNSCLYFV